MKTFKTILFVLCCICTLHLSAQNKNKVTDSVKVWGNCEMCQAKIEKAAKAAGATKATWDVDNKMLFVTYSSYKSSLAKIEKAVAGVGYDTEHETAPDKAYDKLPGCCLYDRKKN